MGRRDRLHQIFKEILGNGNVYFQPPESWKMQYPCIVYQVSSSDTKFADDRPYLVTRRYTVTAIDKDPDSEIPGKVAGLPMCRFDRHYAADNLNHYVYSLFY